MIRAFIIVELINGQRIKYVRDVVADSGVGSKYYAYTNGTNDKYANQTGAGKVKGDYDTLITNYEDSNKFLNFPESGGATKELIRQNLDGNIGNMGYIHNYIAKQSIARIFVTEESADY